MLAFYILASYLLLTAGDILLCLAILERAMAADNRRPRVNGRQPGGLLLWTN